MILKRATFWFSLVSIAICLHNYLGYDRKNILLFISNPVLVNTIYLEPFNHWYFNYESATINSGSADITVAFPSYIVHFLSYFLEGLIIDGLVRLRNRKPRCKVDN
ncbi:hypothetical protein PAECIP111892_00047 [Paenibacillus auburnensis]|uniref:Uncharacterized protein n=1 Tax=Paenibacillus auburnensis TaxID=2905649 RepID=A0ABM9BM40_9BACL|nr:hypothetical protein PAECIP111892_00047 [Paenibacillus auburnensis]